jgi:hypothetical protein
VFTNHVRELLCRRLECLRTLDDALELRERLLVALPQDGFLVGEVVVERRLAQPKVLGDVVEGCRVEPLFTESSQRRMENLLAAPTALLANVG